MALQAVVGSSINRAKIPLPRVLPKSARMKVENTIEQHLSAVDALTAFLDEADGDENLEPSLGATEPKQWSGDTGRYRITTLACVDLEESCEGEAEQCEDEGADEHYHREGCL